MSQKIGKISIICFMVLVAFLPLLYMMINGLIGLRGEQIALINARRFSLLLKSFSYAGIVYLINVLIGISVALFFYNLSKKINRYKWLFAILVPLPSYLYALSFMQLSQKFSQYLLIHFNYVVQLNQSVVSAMVQAMSYFPISVVFSFLVIESIDNELIESAYINLKKKTAIYRVIIPILIRYVCVLELVIFILAFTNFSTPTIFGYETYAMDIFTTYSIDSNLSSAFFLSLPLILVILILLYVLNLKIRNINLKVIFEDKNHLIVKYPMLVKLISSIGVFVFIISIILPIASSIIHVGNIENLIEAIFSTKKEILFSVLISSITALLATMISLVFHYYVDKGRIRKIITLSLLFLFVMPSSYIGISLIRIYNSGILRNIYLSKGMLVIGLLTKYVFFSYLVILISKKMINKDYYDFMNIHFKKGYKRFLLIYSRLILPGIMFSVFFVYTFAYNDIEISLLTIPPGTTTVAITIYNYLHYGASMYVSGISVFNTSIILILGLIIYTYIKKGKRL